MSFTPTYDKRGNKIEGRDPNTTTSNYHCAVCGMRWKVRSQGGQEDVIEGYNTRQKPQALAIGDAGATLVSSATVTNWGKP